MKNRIIDEDIKKCCADLKLYYEKLQGKNILITGATGLIGGFLARVFAELNLNIKLILPVRNLNKAKTIFQNTENIIFIENDITNPIEYDGQIDYVIHCASPTSSKFFVDYPVKAMDIAIEGTKNVLNLAKEKNIKSMVYLSSMEVYGELEADRGLTKECDLGYIDILRPRSSYQIGKRVSEAYCSFYNKEFNVPVKIARLAQTISPTVDYNDSRVFAYFARCIIEKTDIVLKTSGEVIRSFCYITDVITAILTILMKSENGKPYNVGNKNAIVKIKDIAQRLSAKYPSTALTFNISDSEIYPTTTNWQLDTHELEKLGWSAEVSLDEMFERLVESFEQLSTIENKNYNASL